MINFRNKIKKIFLFLIFIANFSFASSDKNCFSYFSFNKEDIITAQKWMSHYFQNYNSTFSMRFKTAMAVSGDPLNTHTSIISFGSGPDVFTPLINFPLASEIHFVDSFLGWGIGSGDVLNELINRLRATHPTAKVKLIELGFLKYTPIFFLSQIKKSLNLESEPSERFLRYRLDSIETKSIDDLNFHNNPIILELAFDQEILGLQIKKIFIHAANFDDDKQLLFLQNYLNTQALGGIVIEGAPYPKSILSFIEKVQIHGKLVLETYSDNLLQQKIISLLSKDERFEVRLISMNTYVRYHETHATEQKTYLVTRVK